jgi:hypothetical protein
VAAGAQVSDTARQERAKRKAAWCQTSVIIIMVLAAVPDTAQEGVHYPRELLCENSREKFAKKY